MFDTDRPGSVFAAVSPPADVAASAAEPARVPLERLEAQICELAGQLAAATCRFLVLLADFDARRGWASWEMSSCAQWLSWKCQLSSGTAREHVRVARALRDLPVIRARFAAAALSYAKVRALTRIATAATEAGLAGPMTANQLERFARAHRRVSAAQDAGARVRRRLTWRPGRPPAFPRKRPRPRTSLPPRTPRPRARRTPARRTGTPRPRMRVRRMRARQWSGRPRIWLTAWSRWRSRSWPGRSPGPTTRRSTRSWCTPAPMSWPGRPPREPPPTFPRKRPRLRRESPVTRRIRPAATSRTARPSACPPPRCYEPEDCDERYRQYLERTPRYTGPTLIPIQV
jgi:hypothetical protein